MLAQLFEAEQHNQPGSKQEYAILAEFGRCLDHILDSVTKVSKNECFRLGASFSQNIIHDFLP